MIQVNMHEAKTKLSALAEKVHKGEKVIIAKAGKPWMELVPVNNAGHRREFGLLKGKIQMASDFDQTPQEVIDSFYGNHK